MFRRNKAYPAGRTLVRGTAFVIALVEGLSLQARPVTIDGARLNARNTPEPAGDAYQTGRGLLALGDVTGAMAAFRQAVLESPQSIDAINGLAVCYDRLGRYDVSRNYYDSALAIDANSALVLNNLGYSLYLQGKLQAAIPVLQRALVVADPTTGATSQRVLTLIASKLRDDKAKASAAVALAEVQAPRARVELAANGEQRLVFGAPRIDRALVANLGEDADLISVAIAPPPVRATRAPSRAGAAAVTVVADDPTRLAQDTAVFDRPASATAARAVVQVVSADDAASAGAVTDTGPKTVYFPDPDVLVSAMAEAATVPVPRIAIAGLVVARPLSPIANRTVEARFTAPHTAALTVMAVLPQLAPRRAANSAAPQVHAGEAAEAPAWLLASRRIESGSLGRTAVLRGPQQHDALAGFDSDDPVLNAFAARMRGDALVAANDDDTDASGSTMAHKAVIIARLEALLARVRPA